MASRRGVARGLQAEVRRHHLGVGVAFALQVRRAAVLIVLGDSGGADAVWRFFCERQCVCACVCVCVCMCVCERERERVRE